nr:subtilisin-like protease SBT5.6 [Ipomoea batatas]
MFLHILACNAKPQVYVVYLGEHSGDKTAKEIEGQHRTYIHHVKRSKEEASASLVHSYKNIINGFSALLTSEEANTIAEMDGVISVFPSESSELHTTRSWDFINMYEGNGDPTSGEELLSKAGGGKDVIVGMVDTGIWPESQSFNDEGMEAVPKSWKGTCRFNILAAWSEASSPSFTPEDHRRVKYNIISGTSMSCPHVSAVAALLKAIHPDWSSAAIKSAIMTSDPSFTCPKKDLSPSNLNYPSLAIAGLKGSMVVKRTVTNVGSANATYSVEVKAPAGYSVKISPMVLRFMEVGEKQSFSVSVKAESVKKVGEFGFGWYKWSDGIHMVKSPIVVSSA